MSSPAFTGEPPGTASIEQDAGGATAAADSDGPDAASTGDSSGIHTDSGNVSASGLLCQADPDVPQSTDYAKPGPFAVGTFELTLTDESRPIEKNAHHDAAPSRALPTRIYYPAQEAALFGQPAVAAGKPFPLLMYSHGYSSNRDEAKVAGPHAASHGYVVVVPEFPLTSTFSNGGSPDVSDVPNQPGDVSFLIDEVLGFSDDPDHLLAGAVDAERIGALGVSAGGLTTLLVSLHALHHDPRIRVAMPIAPLASFLTGAFYHETRSLPLLLVHGDRDAFLDYTKNGRRAFERAAPNARLITVAKGSHAAFALPIDEWLQQLIGTVIVPAEWNRDNPDAMGCAAVAGNLTETDDFLLELDGPANHYERDQIEPPCQGDEMTMEAMAVADQRAILAESVVSFFDAHLGDSAARRQDGCRYLLYEVPKNPAVTLE